MLGSGCPSRPEPSERRGPWLLDAANIPVVAVAVLMVLVLFVLFAWPTFCTAWEVSLHNR